MEIVDSGGCDKGEVGGDKDPSDEDVSAGEESCGESEREDEGA